MNVILSTNKNTVVPRGFKHYEMYPPHEQKVNNLILVINTDNELENCNRRIKYTKFKKLFIIIDVEHSNNDSQVDNERLVKNLISYNFDNHNLFVTNGCYKLPRIYEEIKNHMNPDSKFWNKKYFIEFLVTITFLGLIIFLECNTTTLLQTQISNSTDYLTTQLDKFGEENYNNFTSYFSYELNQLKEEICNYQKYIASNMGNITQEYSNFNKIIAANDETLIRIINSLTDKFGELNANTSSIATILGSNLNDSKNEILEKINATNDSILEKLKIMINQIYFRIWC